MMDARIKSGHDKPILAARPARVFHEPCPSQQRAQEKPDALRTRSLASEIKKDTSKSPQVRWMQSGLSCANGFNGFLRALSGDRLFVTIPGAMRKHRHITLLSHTILSEARVNVAEQQ
jgi:hypothetical protein